jgi:DNA-binding GntR family transcriptional regulator
MLTLFLMLTFPEESVIIGIKLWKGEWMPVVVKKGKSVEAYDRIRTIIRERKLTPGERVKEVHIAQMLGMSRSSVREALVRLESEGVIKNRGSHLGRFLEYLEDQDIHEVLRRYELRGIIEAGAARLAAKNMNGWQIDELRSHAQKVSEFCQSGETEKRRQASYRFHVCLLSKCGNSTLLEVWNEYHLMPVSTKTSELESRILSFLADKAKHEEKLNLVVDAIASHDPDSAERTMREYVCEITEAIRLASQDTLP